MDTKAEQFYPTYTSQERDILLLEFEEAQKIANGQSKVYGQITNILLAIATLAFSLFLNSDNREENETKNFLVSNSILLATLLGFFGAILLRYFVDLQKQITVNARKVVTLRTMLGLDYGHIHLTLPNWSVEGATNPFVIKYFYGWLNFKSIPFWLLTVSINIIWWISTHNHPTFEFKFNSVDYVLPWFFGNVLISVIYIIAFRVFLYDRHENPYLSLVKNICWLLRIKLLKNFEYILYRAKLSYLELDRLNIQYPNLKHTLIRIEENNFYSNRGFSLKALFRAFLSQSKFFRKKYGIIKSGGSTITMQLARTLFIPSQQNKYLRKIGEIMISLWLNRQFGKDEILRLYIASVRYERGILGLAEALRYFFDDLRDHELTKEESLFLIERLSNINSKINWSRIEFLRQKVNPEIDPTELKKIYNRLVTAGKLKS